MAGLPKRSTLSVSVVLFLVLISWVSVCQETQTPSTGLDPVVFQMIIDAVDLNLVATDEEKALLVDLFAVPVEDGSLDVALVAEMLAAVDWEALDEGIGDVIWLIEGTLAAYAEGLVDDPVAALLEGEETDLTPPGIVNAVTKAGGAEYVAQVQELVASGIPPGIVLRVTKAALRNEDLDVAEALAALAELFATNPNISPGQAANAVTGSGTNQNQNQNQNEEQEQNENQDESQNEEQEGNQNGSSRGGNGKSNGNNGNGGKKN
ncbi:hypothetical protein ACFLTM_05085 [Candidatus Bipolaricaulota bacterium]